MRNLPFYLSTRAYAERLAKADKKRSEFWGYGTGGVIGIPMNMYLAMMDQYVPMRINKGNR